MSERGGDRGSVGDPGGWREPRVVRLAVEFVAYAREVERRLRGRAEAVNDQLQRAAASIVANVGEGLDDPAAGDKRQFFRYALRSAGECQRLLQSLATLDLLPPPDPQQGFHLLRDIKMDLLRLTRWTRSSRTK